MCMNNIITFSEKKSYYPYGYENIKKEFQKGRSNFYFLRKSKTWDMRWNWLRDKKTHNVLNYYWDAGKNNDADYFTKHHAPKHHREMRPRYILQGHNVATIAPLFSRCSAAPSHAQGCVFPLAGTNRYRLRWPRQSFPNMTVGHKSIRFGQLHSSH